MSTTSTPENRAAHSLELVDTASLSPYYRNPRVGNVAAIVESVRAHGQYKPLLVNLGTQTGRPLEVLAGNHLLQAGLKLGLERMSVYWLDVDDEEAARIVLVDNRSSDLGGYDEELLAGLLLELPDLGGTGYSDGDLSRLLAGLEMGDEGGLTDPDAVPGVPVAPVSAEGDVWQLGPHTLVCGNSTFVDVVTKAAAGQVLDAMWTDPPYGVEIVGGSHALSPKERLARGGKTIQNDGKQDLDGLLLPAFQAALTVLRPGAPCYIAHADTERVAFETALRDAGYLVRQNLVWVKNALVMGRSDYHYQHEPVLEAEAGSSPAAEPEVEPVTHEPLLYGFTPGGEGRLGRGGPRWYGNNKRTTVFEVPKPAASREHPTMKPTELIVQQLRNSVARGGHVLDLFGGSGSTLIAAHQLHLVAHLVELDPGYCDVICKRYQEHTGVMPIRNGEPVSFVGEQVH